MTKKEICQHLFDRGERSYLIFKNGAYKSNASKMWRKISSDQDLLKKLGWNSKTDFVKVYNREFSKKETEILIEYFQLTE